MPPKKEVAKNGAKAAAPTTKGGLTTAFSDGARYNNLIAALVQNPFHYRFDLFGEKRHAMIQQLPQFGIGGVLWDCEYVLSAYLLSEGFKKNCHQSTFLELGAGTGLAAVVAWLLGGVAVATDLPDVVTAATAPNMTLNQNQNTSGSIGKRKNQLAAANLSWGSMEDCNACQELLARMCKGVPMRAVGAAGVGGAAASGGAATSDAKKAKQSSTAAASDANANATTRKYDYIIAADVIYHSDQHEPLLATMAALMHDKSKLIFVHRRRFENDSNFVEPLLEMFEVVKRTPVKEIMSEYPKDNLTIYEFVVRPGGIPARREGGGSTNDDDGVITEGAPEA